MKNLQYFPFERNQYYYGKLMTQQDFVSEQKYMNDKRRLINRFLHGTGVVSGLQVVRMDEKSFSVEAGLALDEVGREILVSQPAVLRLDQMDGYEQLQEQSSSDAAYLCLAYQEEDVYPSRGMGSRKQGQVYEKSREGYRLYLTSDPYEEDGDTLASMADLRLTIFENEEKGIRFFWVKPSDVTIYVERGAADIGIAGKDIMLEYDPDIYELLDLNIGKCRMCVAGPKGWHDDVERTLKVASKFTNIARDFYARKGRDIDMIKLHGSIELAPIVGLSDVIVDIVETGNTLRDNDLEVVETIVPISARLIANKAAFQFKTKEIEDMRDALAKEVQD